MKDPVVILHGWGYFNPGQHRFLEVKKLLERKKYIVFTPDLPGFGSNILKKEQLFFEDYVDFVKEFLEKQKLKRVTLIGHSFGGRIAIAFATSHPTYISKLILVAPSGIPHVLSLKKRFVQFLAKQAKHIFILPFTQLLYKPARKLLYKSIGEMDYYKSGNLTKTFKNVYAVSILNYLKKITQPTLILWGEKDTFVPVADGVLMHQRIGNSQLVIEKNEGHKFPYENPKLFVKDILSFLE
ncbi:MAG TPA: alpha/beta hydrolase [Patescibacteria group bacterium]|nr:alpha/beta hydrolase [Patescibacteria group bacterium]